MWYSGLKTWSMLLNITQKYQYKDKEGGLVLLKKGNMLIADSTRSMLIAVVTELSMLIAEVRRDLVLWHEKAC